MSSIAVAGSYDGHFTEDDFDEGQDLPTPVPPHEVRVREAGPRARRGPVARVPPGDRRRQLQDRRDGQGRRAVLLLQGDPEAPGRAAAVVPARLARVRPHQHRAGRLRRGGGRSHRAPGRARRPGVPHRRPEAAAVGRRAERVRPGRARAAGGDADRQADDRHAPEGRALVRAEDPGAAGDQAHVPGRPRDPGGGARERRDADALRRPRHGRARWPARGSSCRRWTATRSSCGTTGSATSTRTCSATARSRAPSTARPWSSRAPRAASAAPPR